MKAKKKYDKGGILPPAIRALKKRAYKKEPAVYGGIVGETTVTAPKYEGAMIRRATKDELAPINSNFSFMGVDKSGGLRALRAVFKALGKNPKNLLRLKGTEPNKIYRQVGRDGLEDALGKGKIFDKGQEKILKNNPNLNYTEEAERFLNKDNLSLLEQAQMGKPSSAPFFSKDKLYFKEGFKKGSGKTRDSSTDYLFASKKPIGNEALIPKTRDLYLQNFDAEKPIGVLKPKYNDLKNYKIYKKGEDGEYYRMILKELAQRFK